MFYEQRYSLVTDLQGRWESYEVFTAPLNWRFESGDRVEFNVVPTGEQLPLPFTIDEVELAPGSYHWTRYRIEGEAASKRKFSGQATWWFGGFYDGSLDEIEVEASWNPSPLVTFGLTAERNIGRLPAGDFAQTLFGVRTRFNFSSDLQLNSFIQYDDDSAIGGIEHAAAMDVQSGRRRVRDLQPQHPRHHRSLELRFEPAADQAAVCV